MILCKLCSVSIGGSVLCILTQFLSNRSQHGMVDGCLSKLVNVVSRVPQEVFWARHFSSCTPWSFFSFCKINWSVMLNSTLMAVVPSFGVRVAVAESLSRDLGRVSEWCEDWRMKLNASKTKTMIVARLRTLHPPSPPINYWRYCAEGVWWPWYIGLTFDSKMTFEKHLRSVSSAASPWLGILRKSWRVFHDRSLLGRCFRGFVLPVLEYCSVVWCTAADTHLELLYRAVSGASFLTAGVFNCDIAHRDLSQYCVCCIRSGVIWCAPFMVLYLIP